ncbi:MAG: iron ABC transporter permease [Bacteroidales bacterium]|nr:iron ABC transporter permease [Bacteroidales bacterium]
MKNIFFKSFFSPWVISVLIITLLISMPILVIFSGIWNEAGDFWVHIRTELVPQYIRNTLILAVGVSIISLIFGVNLAWLISNFDFPGRNFFDWALIMPIAIPAYISGFAWAGILDYTSPLYTFLRNNFGWNTGQFLFFDILSISGAIVIFSFALYPYIFLIAKAYFDRQSGNLFEASASLGRSKMYTYFNLALPMARPAIAAGLSLVLMEILNDYGLVKYFGVDTFTTGIFSAWFAFGDKSAAMKLAVYLMVFVLFLLIFEKMQRRRLRYSGVSEGKLMSRIKVSGFKGWLITFFSIIPFIVGFAFPFLQLVYWSFDTWEQFLTQGFIRLLTNSFLLAAISALIVMISSVLIIYTLRLYHSRRLKLVSVISTLGYALPGAVVALGLLVILSWTENFFIQHWGLRIVITGTWFGLIYAYLVRFMAVGYQSVESGSEKISRSIDQAALSLGAGKFRNLWFNSLPLLRASIISGFLLVMIDVLKELPLTLLLRPFNFDTLAIRAFEYASDERVAEAAPAAVMIILAGLMPVLIINRLIGRTKI